MGMARPRQQDGPADVLARRPRHSLVQFLDASFAEMLGEDAQPVTRPTGQSAAEYGNGLMPVDADHASLNSPIFNYPYARSLEALDAMRKGRDPDPCHGWKLRYTNPLTGGDAMPTMATLHPAPRARGNDALPRDRRYSLRLHREGAGQSRIGDETISWGPRDIFVAPSWAPVVHEVAEEAVLFLVFRPRGAGETRSLARAPGQRLTLKNGQLRLIRAMGRGGRPRRSLSL
jgi:gentisate 1,2-dioxygenase